MIPYPIPALRGATVLVTRPADQAARLCKLIREHGGEAIEFPVLAIEAVENCAPAGAHDWLIFTSANAVRFGLQRVDRSTARVAAIGKATAAALQTHDVRIDALPESSSSSEALLAHSAFADAAGQRALIVKGVGGRDALRTALSERGTHVSTLEVYRRVRADVSATQLHELEQRWRDTGVDVVTVTSVETLTNLAALAAPLLLELQQTPFVTLSQRIVDAARQQGMQGEAILSRDADDESLVGAIAAWYARAR